MLNPFRRTTLSARQERAVQRTLQQLRQQRRQRFYTVQALMLGGPDGQVM